jgi:hypothetical protein
MSKYGIHGSADYKIIKMVGYLTWKLVTGHWTLICYELDRPHYTSDTYR